MSLIKRKKIFFNKNRGKKYEKGIGMNYMFLILGSMFGFFVSILANSFYDVFVNENYNLKIFIFAVLIVFLLAILSVVLEYMINNLIKLIKKPDEEFYSEIKRVIKNHIAQSIVLKVLFILWLILWVLLFVINVNSDKCEDLNCVVVLINENNL